VASPRERIDALERQDEPAADDGGGLDLPETRTARKRACTRSPSRRGVTRMCCSSAPQRSSTVPTF